MGRESSHDAPSIDGSKAATIWVEGPEASVFHLRIGSCIMLPFSSSHPMINQG